MSKTELIVLGVSIGLICLAVVAVMIWALKMKRIDFRPKKENLPEKKRNKYYKRQCSNQACEWKGISQSLFDTYCPYCGSKLISVEVPNCPFCDEPLFGNHPYCANCGQPIKTIKEISKPFKIIPITLSPPDLIKEK